MKSLKDTLNNFIQEKGYVEYGEIVQLSLDFGAKVSAAERRLRGLCADRDEAGNPQVPDIEPVMGISRKGTEYIKAYRFKEKYPKYFVASGEIPLEVIRPGKIIKIGGEVDWQLQSIIISGKSVPVFAAKKEVNKQKLF